MKEKKLKNGKICRFNRVACHAKGHFVASQDIKFFVVFFKVVISIATRFPRNLVSTEIMDIFHTFMFADGPARAGVASPSVGVLAKNLQKRRHYVIVKETQTQKSTKIFFFNPQ